MKRTLWTSFRLVAGAVTRSLDDDIVITPLWNEAVSFSDAEGAYVVVPFNLPLGKIFARKQFDEEIPEDEKFANTDIRLFIEKKHENEYLYSIIHLTGNYSYVVEGSNDMASLRLDDLASFSGSICHYSLQGEMMWGIFIIMGGLWEKFLLYLSQAEKSWIL
ncbi:hypothetical protein [Bacteroides sp.]|uniref:hypothetical protein n=1 Tax=Bacteroides sp. TaxID=29523 RepID=UPI003AB4ABE1